MYLSASAIYIDCLVFRPSAFRMVLMLIYSAGFAGGAPGVGDKCTGAAGSKYQGKWLSSLPAGLHLHALSLL